MKIKDIEQTRGGKIFFALFVAVFLLLMYWENGGTIMIGDVDIAGRLVFVSAIVLGVLQYTILYIYYLLRKQYK